MSQKYSRFNNDSKESDTSVEMPVNGNSKSVNNNKSSSSLNNQTTIGAEPVIEMSGEHPNGDILSHTQLITRREKFRRIIENIYFRLFGLTVIVVDLILLVVDLSTTNKTHNAELVYNIFSLLFGTYFVAEVSLRIYAKT